MKCSVLTLCLFLSSILSAQINIYDGFDDNSNGWPESKSDNHSVGVKEGVFLVEGTGQGSWLFSQRTKIDYAKYFRYELTVNQESVNSADQGSGMCWGISGDTSMIMFLIYNDGSFAVMNRVGPSSQSELVARQKHAAIKKGVNNLRVEHLLLADKYNFIINEQLVGSCAYLIPTGVEFGMISDMPGKVSFDNFWLVQDQHSRNDFSPSTLRSGPCGEGQLRYTSTYSLYNVCLPEGWRVEETADFSNVWNIQNHYAASGIRITYSTIPPQLDYLTIASGDFASVVDSMPGVTEVSRSEPQSVAGVREGVQAWKFTCTFKFQDDGVSYKVIRYYIFNKANGQFLLFQIQLPLNRPDVWMLYDQVASSMVSSISWPAE